MQSNEQYRNHILEVYDRAIEALVNCGISNDIIDYRRGYITPRRPTAAHSDFLINRQLGDWTETLLRASFNQQFEEFRAVKYGAGGNLIAGETGFTEMFEGYHNEIRTIGKRPDLLIYDHETISRLSLSDDISELEPSQLTGIARMARRAMEVRSSRYLAAEYRRVKRQEQSFTPKLEDLPILAHWIVEHEVPCFYTQVFFDEVHTISFERILQVIQETGDEYVKQVERNQRKYTFYIPVTEGILIGQITEAPTWEAKIKSMNDGRIIIYATPEGGRMELRKELIQYLGI